VVQRALKWTGRRGLVRLQSALLTGAMPCLQGAAGHVRSWACQQEWLSFVVPCMPPGAQRAGHAGAGRSRVCQCGARRQERLSCSRASRRARSVWDMRAERIVRTLETGKAVTSLEVQRDGSFLATADGSEVRARARLHAPAQAARHSKMGTAVVFGEQAAPYALT
jgi:hypothetical protein